MEPNVSAESLNIMKTALTGALAKTFTQSGSAITGLTEYSLQEPALDLYPQLRELCILTTSMPKIVGGAGIQANWRAVTGINTSKKSMGIAEGKRGAAIDVSVDEYIAAFRTIGLEGFATDQAAWAGEGFDNIYARASRSTLIASMIGLEKIVIGGQGTYGLGHTPKPGTTASDTGGSLNKGTFSVRCVALTADGMDKASVALGITQQYVRTNMYSASDTMNGGSAIISALSNDCVISTGSAGKITCTVEAVPGAAGYAWFWGTKSSDILIGAITTVNAYTILDVAAGTQKISDLNTTNDYSQDVYVFDGIMAQLAKTGSNAYIKSLNNATLTGDGAGSIVEIDAALKSIYDNYKTSPDALLVSSQEQANLLSKVQTAGTNAAQRFTVNVGPTGVVAGGYMVGSYRNKWSIGGVAELPVVLHPFIPAGTIVLYKSTPPYMASGVTNTIQLLCRKDWFQREWPIMQMQREYGTYLDGVLQIFFPPAFGIISNIKNG